MRVSLTIDANSPDDLEHINRLVQALQGQVQVATLEPVDPVNPVKPPEQQLNQPLPETTSAKVLAPTPVEEPHEEGNGATAPKRRGRPPKMAREPVAAGAADDGPIDLSDDPKVVQIVTDFLAENKALGAAVLSLLREYHAEKVSSVPVGQRAEFLSRMDGLAALR